ncbi:MAG: hypothetical protein K8T90_05855 [Planctomycetes bacterium]|nr:hypothetical protein [Planctomycetota bacterium]
MRPTSLRTPVLPALAFAIAFGLTACGEDAPRGDPLKGGDAPASGPAMPKNPHGPGGIPTTRPDGQPAMPGMGMPGAAPAGAMREPSPAPFTWTTPEGWKSSPPSSGMRMAQFDLPTAWPDGGAVQCVVFSAMLGGRQGNLDRWIGQVSQTDGSSTKDKTKISETKVGALTVTRIEIRGSYADGMAKVPREAGDALFLGAVIGAGTGDEVWTIKLAGPRAAVESEMAKFDALLASIKTQ